MPDVKDEEAFGVSKISVKKIFLKKSTPSLIIIYEDRYHQQFF